MTYLTKSRGFSLLELSIVLVIIGLLAGGVMTGQALIRAAELRSAVNEFQKYQTAINAFRDKYQAIPGDMKMATSFWGKDNTNCSGNSGTAATPGTCNGNGDGRVIPTTGGSGLTGEPFQFWKHLALAGLIEGTYTGLAGASGETHAIVGTNVPASHVTNAGWATEWVGVWTGNGTYYTYDLGNYFMFGANTATYYPVGANLKPEEAWNFDTKVDDGLPGRGRIIPNEYPVCSTSTGPTDYAGVYRLNNTTVTCQLLFAKMY